MANVKLVAAVVHEVVTGRLFDDWVELAEAIKDRCAAVRVAYDSGSITEAVRLVERSRPVFTTPPRRTNPRHIERVDDARPLSRAEAKDLCERLGAALGREQANGRRRA